MGGARPPLASVETVREELKRLGYLDSSLDRFVLGGAGGATPVRASLRAAARAFQIRAAAPACAAQNRTARRAGTARSPDASRPQ